MTYRLRVLALATAACVSTGAEAATITARQSEGWNFVTLQGRIVSADGAEFNRVIASLPDQPTVIALHSPGGIISAATLGIGQAIRSHGYRTLVGPGNTCASACGLIWLAGVKRYLTPTGRVGFHAAYGDDGEESGQGNAVVGAYLNQLGMSFQAVAYLTAAAPSQMQWLDTADANRYGIPFTLITSGTPPERTQHSTMPSPVAQTTSYADGRRARIEYELWFTRQTGTFRDGALYWSRHRDDSPQPLCTMPHPERYQFVG